MERRLNPATGKLFKLGDKREDGYFFQCYLPSRKGKGNYMGEKWLSPSAHERQKKNSKKEQGKTYERRRAVITKIKMDRGCADCGYRGHHAALQYDHLPGVEKLFEIGRCPRPIPELLEEIAKCEVVCANCHSIRTYERRKMR